MRVTQFVKSLLLRVYDVFYRFILSTFPQGARNLKSDNGKKLSDSEKTPYVSCIESIANRPELLLRFRRVFMYREIVETVSYQQGKRYLNRIKKLNDNVLPDLHAYKSNDFIGNPITYKYPNKLSISPTTLRYVSVSRELRKIFGSQLRGKFVEIGAGYGGQAAILMKDFNVSNYSIYDLPDAQFITRFFLDQVQAGNHVMMRNLNEGVDEKFDFVISNYAFSELPRELQDQYIIQVLARSKCGYLIMNSGKSNYTGRQIGKYTLGELREKLPPFEILEELPSTGPDNYVIVWGHERVRNPLN